jgi:hypothetical protein
MFNAIGQRESDLLYCASITAGHLGVTSHIIFPVVGFERLNSGRNKSPSMHCAVVKKDSETCFRYRRYSAMRDDIEALKATQYVDVIES